jgi:aspartate racemase
LIGGIGVAPLDAYFVGRGISRIGLLGTRVVMRTRLYGKLAHTEVLALDEETDLIGQTYQDVAVAGTCSPAQQALILDAGRRLIAAGADAVVLAGTDLNLTFDGQKPGYLVINALDVDVVRLADVALDLTPLSDVTV